MVESVQAQAADIRVRQATIEDCDEVVDMNCKMAFETENKTLDKTVVKPATVRIIQNQKWGRTMVAYDENDPEKKLLGTIQYTYEMSVAMGGLIYWIQSVYVCAEARKKGVFRALFNKVKEDAEADPLARSVRLYVELENEVAQTVYSKMGMTKFDHYEFNEVDFVL